MQYNLIVIRQHTHIPVSDHDVLFVDFTQIAEHHLFDLGHLKLVALTVLLGHTPTLVELNQLVVDLKYGGIER